MPSVRGARHEPSSCDALGSSGQCAQKTLRFFRRPRGILSISGGPDARGLSRNFRIHRSEVAGHSRGHDSGATPLPDELRSQELPFAPDLETVFETRKICRCAHVDRPATHAATRGAGSRVGTRPSLPLSPACRDGVRPRRLERHFPTPSSSRRGCKKRQNRSIISISCFTWARSCHRDKSGPCCRHECRLSPPRPATSSSMQEQKPRPVPARGRRRQPENSCAKLLSPHLQSDPGFSGRCP